MSKKEENIAVKLSVVLPKLDKENQKYVLGLAEGMAMVKEPREEKQLQEA